MPDSFARIASLLLAITFGWAAVAKVSDLNRWRTVLSSYGLPLAVSRVAIPLAPLAELSIAVILLAVSLRVGAAAAIASLSLFSLAIMRARSVTGDRLPCGCFGGSRERHYSTMMMRNSALGALAAIVLLGSDGLRPVLPPAPSSAEILPAALALVGGALIAWLGWQTTSTLRRKGR